MPNQRKTPTHNIVVPGDLWQRALAIARARNETLSGVLRRALERYVRRHEKDEP